MELDPRLKLFSFDLNTMINYEEATGKKFTTFNPVGEEKEIRAVLWAGIKDNLPGKEGDSFALKDAGKMLNWKNQGEVTKIILDAMGVGEAKN